MEKCITKFILSIFLLPALAFSQALYNDSSSYCHESRILVSASSIQSKNLKFLKEFNQAGKKKYQITKNLKKVKILSLDTIKSNLLQSNSSSRVFVKYDSNLDTCQRIKKALRKKKKTRDGKIIRKIQCSCDFEIKPSDTNPNDTSFNLLYGLKNSNGLNMPGAWDIHTGDSDVVVGINDTGIDYNHPDLAANIWQNPFEIPGNSIDDEGNGYVDDIYGWDFADNDSNPMDVDSHGTHVAGTVGAVGNNGTGVAGVNWQVSMMALKIFTNSGSGSYSDAVEAMNYAADMYDRGVNVVVTNNSYGGGPASSVAGIMAGAFAAHTSRNILYVASAGNSSLNMDNGDPSQMIAPAAINQDIIFSIAATTSSGVIAGYSNYGTISVDIGAPGSSIYSTIPGNSYGYKSGTSMAAPHVTGMVALLAGYNVNLNWSEIKDRIIQTATFNSNLSGLIANPRIVNANNMLLNTTPATPTATPTRTSTITATATSTATNTATASITPTASNTPQPSTVPTLVPTAVSTPVVAPTTLPTTQPVIGQKFKLKGGVINRVTFSSRKKKAVVGKLNTKIYIYDEAEELVTQLDLSSPKKWEAELPEGEYTVRCFLSNKNYKLSPARLKIDLDKNVSAANFYIVNR